MAIDVTPARVRATADLARLDLRDEEVGAFVSQLQKILDHVAELERLDVSQVPPTRHVAAIACPLAEDVPSRGVTREEALAQAPRSELGSFVVPQFVEE